MTGTSLETTERREPLGGKCRLIVESVGAANAAVLSAVRQITKSPIQDVARLVYQAPSELASGLDWQIGRDVAEILSDAGLQVRVAEMKGDFQPGTGNFELALSVRNVDQLPGIVAEVAALLGTEPTVARRVVCRAPAVLLSKVSDATVQAVRRRFEPYGATIDHSDLESARYDAVVVAANPNLKRAVSEFCREVAKEASFMASGEVITVANLPHAASELLWERLSRTGAQVAVCNRDFERYDIRLDEAPDGEDMRQYLTELAIPAHVVPKILRALPVVVAQDLPRNEMEACLLRVAQLGGQATALPVSSQRYSLVLKSITDKRSAVQAMVSFAEISEAEAVAAVNAPSGALIGSLTKITALWLRRMLEQQGARVGMESR